MLDLTKELKKHFLGFAKPDKILDLKKVFLTPIIVVISIGLYYSPIDWLQGDARTCFSIFILAALLWIFEAIPAFATSIIVIVLCVFLLSDPSPVISVSELHTNYKVFLSSMSNPILILFFAGFILSIAIAKYGFDITIADIFVRRFAHKIQYLLLAIISVTGLFSMFMSNTATTAMMLAMISPILHQMDNKPHLQKAIALAIPIAANIGGIGTIIGTPPNALAASYLLEIGYQIDFLTWMIIAMPLVIILLATLWIVLFRYCKDEFHKPLELHLGEHPKLTKDLKIVIGTFILTVLLWLTESIHNISAPIIALLPIGIFTTLKIIDSSDLKKVEWDIIFLIAGGLTLGIAMKVTGLSEKIIHLFPFEKASISIVIIVLSVFTVCLSNFMSNTAASSLIIPLIASMGGIISPQIGVLLIAFSASLSMSLPISTPPNAIAYSTKYFSTQNLLVIGTLISFIGLLIIFIAFTFFGDNIQSLIG